MSLTEQARGGGAAALRAQQGPPNERAPRHRREVRCAPARPRHQSAGLVTGPRVGVAAGADPGRPPATMDLAVSERPGRWLGCRRGGACRGRG